MERPGSSPRIFFWGVQGVEVAGGDEEAVKGGVVTELPPLVMGLLGVARATD